MKYKEEPLKEEARKSRAKQNNERVKAWKTDVKDSNVNTASNMERVSRKKSSPKKKSGKRWIKWIVAECLALIFIFSYTFFARKWNLIQRASDFKENEVKNEELTIENLQKMKGYWMLAVFGVDSRDSNVGKGANSDVIMLCCINQDTGEIKLVSVYRDTYLNVSDKNMYNKINYAYCVGGAKQAVKALNKNLDLNITDYVTFNWKAVVDTINILGGVDVEISPAEFKYINSYITETVKVTNVGSHHLKSAGMNHLDGVQAVAYARLRYMDSDFARTERQRKIVNLAFEKTKKADIAVVNNIVEVVFPQVATSVGLQDVANMAFGLSKYHLGETMGFPDARGDANMGKKGACVIPKTLVSNVVNLHKFLFGDEDYTTTETVKTISAKISADTGLYKEGKGVGHVSTEGSLPKETKKAAVSETKETKTETKEETKEETKVDETKETLVSDPINKKETKETMETDENGRIIYPGETEVDIDGPGSTYQKESQSSLKPLTPTEKPVKESAPDTSNDKNKTETKIENTPGNEKNETKSSIHPGSEGSTEPTYARFPGDTQNTQAAPAHENPIVEAEAQAGPGGAN